MIKKYLPIIGILILVSSCSDTIQNNPIKSAIEIKVDSVFSLMTLKEKIGQLNQYSVGEEMTGPNQDNEYSQKRYDQLINGDVGSVLNYLVLRIQDYYKSK